MSSLAFSKQSLSVTGTGMHFLRFLDDITIFDQFSDGLACSGKGLLKKEADR